MLFKERNYLLIQVIQSLHSIRHSLRVVSSNHAAPKKLLERVKQLDVSLVLHNCELGKDLKTGRHVWMSIDSDEETAFAVDKTDDPLRFQLSRT